MFPKVVIGMSEETRKRTKDYRFRRGCFLSAIRFCNEAIESFADLGNGTYADKRNWKTDVSTKAMCKADEADLVEIFLRPSRSGKTIMIEFHFFTVAFPSAGKVFIAMATAKATNKHSALWKKIEM